jgi:hypothetical protein
MKIVVSVFRYFGHFPNALDVPILSKGVRSMPERCTLKKVCSFINGRN